MDWPNSKLHKIVLKKEEPAPQFDSSKVHSLLNEVRKENKFKQLKNAGVTFLMSGALLSLFVFSPNTKEQVNIADLPETGVTSTPLPDSELSSKTINLLNENVSITFPKANWLTKKDSDLEITFVSLEESSRESLEIVMQVYRNDEYYYLDKKVVHTNILQKKTDIDNESLLEPADYISENHEYSFTEFNLAETRYRNFLLKLPESGVYLEVTAKSIPEDTRFSSFIKELKVESNLNLLPQTGSENSTERSSNRFLFGLFVSVLLSTGITILAFIYFASRKLK